ncbi:MAG TPA: hypothetical protein VEL76_38440, partial [Gemmataceae bacterium]|nr:hypothetical protein [Gemmataceae bacterium]
VQPPGVCFRVVLGLIMQLNVSVDPTVDPVSQGGCNVQVPIHYAKVLPCLPDTDAGNMVHDNLIPHR